MDLESIRKYPKVDLHRHLDGDIRPELIFRLAEEEGLPMPVKTPEELVPYFLGLPGEDIFPKAFGLVTSLMQTEENLYDVAFEEARNLRDDGIFYAEIRFAPQYHTGESEYYGHRVTGKSLSLKSVIRAVAHGLFAGSRAYNVKAKLIISIGREISPERGLEIAQAAVNHADLGVVAIDLACDESTYPSERHALAFNATIGSPIKRTVHAGEFGDMQYHNILTAITELKADRIGHAIPLIHHSDLIGRVIEGGIAIEMCPQGNVIGGSVQNTKELEIAQLLSRGVQVTINSDDPTMFGYTLSDTFHMIYQDYDFVEGTLDTLTRNAIYASFLGYKEREELYKQWCGW